MRENQRPQEEELSPKGKGRREFLFKAAKFGAAIGITGLVTEEVIRRSLSSPENKETKIQKLKEIGEFKNLGNGVLVICANQDEFGSVYDTLREHNGQRSPQTKFEISRENGVVTVEIPVRKRQDKGLPVGQYPSGLNKIHLTAVVQGTEALRNLGSDYGMVQLRGHTMHMENLLQDFKKHRKNNAILSMGGCESVQFMDEVYDPSTPILADKTGRAAYTKHNTHNLVALIDRLGLADSWEELYQMMSQNSKRLREQTVMPGDPDYYRVIENEKNNSLKANEN